MQIGDSVSVAMPSWMATQKQLAAPQRGQIVIITPKAIFLKIDGVDRHEWLPISQIIITPLNDTTFVPPEADDGGGLAPIRFAKTTPWQHQLKGYWFCYGKKASLLGYDMGTGKSAIAVHLIINRGHRRILIVCPLSVVDVWPSEFKRHAGKPIYVKALKGTVAKKVKDAQEALATAEALDLPCVLVINYESVWRPPFGPSYNEKNRMIEQGFAMEAGFDLVVADEVHKVKSSGGIASKFLAKLGQKVLYRLGLTGTPMPHSPLDIYGIFRFLDPNIFGWSFSRFRAQYADCHPMFKSKVLRYKNQVQLNDKVYSLMIRVMKRDVLDLPPVTHVERFCTLEPAARKAYDQLEANFVAGINGGVITVQNALGKLLRLQQLTSGYLPLQKASESFGDADDDFGDVVLTEISTAKRKLLEDELDNLPIDEPIVVFAKFTKDLELIKEVAEKSGRRACELSGQRKELLAWQNGEYDLIAVQVKTGESGISLVRSCYVFYYSLGFSLGDFDQSLARADRPGQERPVTYTHLLVENSIDGKVYQSLRDHKDVIESIISMTTGETPTPVSEDEEEFEDIVDRYRDMEDEEVDA